MPVPDAVPQTADARRPARAYGGDFRSRSANPMATDPLYYPPDGPYVPIPGTIYAQYVDDAPNPCRKYHVSSHVDGAEIVASITLAHLAAHRVMHKVVRTRSLLVRQTYKDEDTFGDQAGKFITVYMPGHVPQRNELIERLGQLLAAAAARHPIQPCPRIPRSRAYQHVFAEQPLDAAFFIYGGFLCDPGE